MANRGFTLSEAVYNGHHIKPEPKTIGDEEYEYGAEKIYKRRFGYKAILRLIFITKSRNIFSSYFGTTSHRLAVGVIFS